MELYGVTPRRDWIAVSPPPPCASEERKGRQARERERETVTEREREKGSEREREKK